jgi:hypothetical protein
MLRVNALEVLVKIDILFSPVETERALHNVYRDSLCIALIGSAQMHLDLPLYEAEPAVTNCSCFQGCYLYYKYGL